VNEDWDAVVARLGGAAALEAGARETGAFRRPRKIRSAVDLLRFTLAYCLSEMGLRLTAAWGAALGLADMSNVALLGRLRNMEAWLARLVSEALAAERPAAAQSRLIRVVDATTVPQAGAKTRGRQPLWRLHGALDLPSERFGFVELTDEGGGERFDRAPVRARSASATAPTPSRTGWRRCSRAAGTCWCGRAGPICAGWMRRASGLT
jgi:hypothetical protein